ncbi:MAG: hypothetical protein HQK76_12770 [Desulfobacterales bacterium]|nr:hypothetical protein [Desulfobacterales bacterium]
MNIIETNKYFEKIFKKRWERKGELCWDKFSSRRESLEKQKETLFPKHPQTWQMVDHGWEHAEALYTSLPRFIWSIETFKQTGKKIFENAAELYSLLLAAYLHDIGMGCSFEKLNNDFKKAAKNGIFPYQSAEVLDWLRHTVDTNQLTGDYYKSYNLSIIRTLHPEIGAWMCSHGQILSDEDERETISQIVFRHAKRVTKNDAKEGNLKLYGYDPEPVRIGLIASLIAIADSCQIGIDREPAWEEHLEAVQHELNVWNAFLKATNDNNLKTWCSNNIKILKNQPEHILKHSIIKDVSLGPEGFIVVPVLMEATHQWFQMPIDATNLTREDLIKQACSDDIGRELNDLVSDYFRQLFDVSIDKIIPPILDVNADSWEHLRKKVQKNDKLWKEFIQPPPPCCLFFKKIISMISSRYHLKGMPFWRFWIIIISMIIIGFFVIKYIPDTGITIHPEKPKIHPEKPKKLLDMNSFSYGFSLGAYGAKILHRRPNEKINFQDFEKQLISDSLSEFKYKEHEKFAKTLYYILGSADKDTTPKNTIDRFSDFSILQGDLQNFIKKEYGQSVLNVYLLGSSVSFYRRISLFFDDIDYIISTNKYDRSQLSEFEKKIHEFLIPHKKVISQLRKDEAFSMKLRNLMDIIYEADLSIQKDREKASKALKDICENYELNVREKPREIDYR